MSDPVTPVGPEAPQPPKKKGKGKIFLIVGLVLVVLCCGGGFLVYKLLGKAVDVAYAEGKCVDTVSNSATPEAIVPKPVECSDAKAVAKILKVADGKTQTDAEAVCGAVEGVTSYAVIMKTDGSTKLLCLGPK